MAIKSTNTKIRKTFFKVFNLVIHYKGSWTEEPYFDQYTLTKTIYFRLWKVLLFRRKTTKITHTDYLIFKKNII